MPSDIHALAEQLLQRLANSIHDREDAPTDFTFRLPEIHVVEEFLVEALELAK